MQVISPQRIPATVAPTLLLSPSVFSQAKSSGSLSVGAQESCPAPLSLSRPSMQEEGRVLSKSQLQVTLLHLIQVKCKWCYYVTQIHCMSTSLHFTTPIRCVCLVPSCTLQFVASCWIKHFTWWFLLVCFRLTALSWTQSMKPTPAALLRTPAASTDDCTFSIRTPCPEYRSHPTWTCHFLLWIPAPIAHAHCISFALYNQSTWLSLLQSKSL